MSRHYARAFAAPALGLVALAAIALTNGCSNLATGNGAPTVKLDFEKYTLKNGLEVILRKDSRLPVVAVNVWYHVGPAKEAAGRTGFAHLFEHMMFQGAGHVPADGHFRLLEGAGASNVNGSTSYDRTNYLEDLPANQLELALWLESDRMGFLLDRLDATMLANQQDVVRNERRQSIENAPYGLGEEEVAHRVFPQGHPYFAAVMGSHADIQAARLEDVREFFKSFYTPNNATLCIVGDIDVDSTKAMVEKYFGTIARGPNVTPVNVTTPPITAERRSVITDQVELPRVYINWLTPPFYKPGDAEADMAAHILGGGKASRLYKSLVYDKKIAQDVHADQQSSELTSVFQIVATAKPGHTTAELEAAIQSELDSLAHAGPSEAEMAATRNVIHTQILTSIEAVGALADRLNQYNHYTGDPGYLNNDLGRYSAVTAAQIKDLVASQLVPNKRVVVEVQPGQKILPPAPPTPPAPKAAPNTTVSKEAWRSDIPKPHAVSTAPLPSATRFTLANGLPVYLVASHDLPVVTAHLVVRAGSASDPPGAPGLAGYTLSMLDEGTEKRDALTIARDLDAIGVSLGSDMGRDGCSISARGLKRNATAMLEVLADCALAPAFPAKEVERVRTERLTSLLQDRDDPSRAAFKIMWRDLYGPANPYGHMVIGTEPTLKAATRDDIVKLYQSAFRPDNAALILAGDLSESEARSLANDAFGKWKAAAGAAPVPERPVTPAPERVLIADKPGVPQTTMVVAEIGIRRSDPDYEKMNVMNQVLGGLFSSRVNMNLREKHGYTYGAFSSLPENREPGPYFISAGIRTDVTGPAVAEVMKEVHGMLAAPVSDDELKLAKESIARTLPAQFQTSASTANTIGQLFLFNLPPDYYQGLPLRLESITRDDVLQATKKHLRPDDFKVIAVGDRAKIEPQLASLKLGTIGHRTLDGEPVGAGGRVRQPTP
ncbi:MAG: insulinase family protein [Candidatus Eisenbacteria bacterium]|uniref:Insulinase family protein n=1 Tax=Eiseniibacteriota bacterium TaxID=2212470 RepID=A0A9D6L5U9_UNCEI|nr:insulinase family protein [Candidatus Eisenbacteria bacterium]MBI3539351.1 insulinase family protein [Candidatus Eisenbacteria bacterium]